jgi:hypothetical protein
VVQNPPFFYLQTPPDLSQVAPAFSSESYAFPEDLDNIAEQQHAVVYVHFCLTVADDLQPGQQI